MKNFRLLLIAIFISPSLAIFAESVLTISPEPVAGSWHFDAARAQIVTDTVANAATLQMRPVRGKDQKLEFILPEPLRIPAVIEAEVRLPLQTSTLEKTIPRAKAILSFIESDSTNAHTLTFQRGRPRDDHGYMVTVSSRTESRPITFKPRYTLASISPLMDDNVRLVLERTVQQLPLAHLRFHRLRLELRADSTRFYVNGRLVGDYPPASSTGRASLTLTDDARLLSLRARPLEEFAASFVPVPLDDFYNATGPAAWPAQRGQIAPIHGVPIIASAGFKGEDHLDVGASVSTIRMGTFREGDARESVAPPEEIEMTRFTMRVPKRTYRRAWVLAAADGEPNSAPVLTVRFYTPKTCWAVDAVTSVPEYKATSAPGQARRVGLRAGNSLWLIPVELDAAALAADPMDCLEITKEIYPYRGHPDPAYYGSFPGGLPSSVRVYGLTLEEAPVWARGTGTQKANLYQDPEKPIWRVLLRNLTARPVDADIQVTVTDPAGKSSVHPQRVTLAANSPKQTISIQPPAPAYGLYTVQTTVKAGDFQQSRTGTFLRLPPNTRQATPVNSPWGLWSWNGTHKTHPTTEDNLRNLKALGAINSFQLDDRPNPKEPAVSLAPLRQKYGIAPEHYRLEGRNLPAWSSAVTPDPDQVRAYADRKGKEAAEQLREHPDLQYVNVFAENAISLRVTHGLSPWAMGQPWFELDERETKRIREHWQTAKAAVAGVRQHAPKLKFLFGHGAGNFAQPFFMLPDWDNDLFDGFGMDLPQFERMPERQPRATEPSLLYFLNHQLKEKGLLGKKEIVHLESYFPPSGPLALTEQEQANSIVRTAVLSLSLGTTKFLRTWSDQTSGDGWGSSHYGRAGVFDREPEANPKPAAAAYATMSQVLDLAKYDGWLETGSRSAYCVRFKDTNRLVYAVWTFRGTRPLTLTLDGTATRYDQNGNAHPVDIKDRQATVTLSPTPQWIVVRNGTIQSAAVGEPTYTEAPAVHRKLLEDFESTDWTYDAGIFERYQNNHWDMPREPGQMRAERTRNATRNSIVFRVELTKPDQKKPMVGFYGVYTPPQPIAIPGKGCALGLWVNGRSAWNRFIYEITDAKGERWLSCGTKDAWNCDDIHSWSSVNHDGWRYLRFPLPGNAPGDNFREADTVWWGADAEGIVDLPVKITKIMIEMRPQMIYVDQMLPVIDLAIELDDLTVEYARPEDMTDTPVKVQMAAADVLLKGELAPLPNPHAVLQEQGVGTAPTIAKLSPTDEPQYEGNRLLIDITPVEGATSYKGYVAVYSDGRGALPLGVDKNSKHRRVALIKSPNQLLFDGLKPATPLYFFVTYVDANGKESKPSPIRQVVLKDEFPFK
ncbi:MAG: hypothetical protein PCFJNLEI_03525 [Verrucomicrobiae bacterium]|nr:hypothetical protein [Verrucomicrobiae bacterium]